MSAKLKGFDILAQKPLSLDIDEVFEIREHKSPLILSLPHSGTWIPPEALAHVAKDRYMLLDADLHTEVLFDRVRQMGSSVRTRVHPMIINQNRGSAFDIHELISEQRLAGQIILKKPYTKAQRKAMIAKYYWPYQRALRVLINKAKKSFGYALLIDGHSLNLYGGPHAADPGEMRPAFLLGTNGGESTNQKIADALLSGLKRGVAKKGWEVRSNFPYGGGHITLFYGRPAKKEHAIQIETQRFYYMHAGAAVEDINEKDIFTIRKANMGIMSKALEKGLTAALNSAHKLYG